MGSLVDALAALHASLRAEFDVDLGTEPLVSAARELTTHAQLKGTRRAVKERLVVVDEARARLASVLPRIEQLLRVWPFTDDGWPETRAALVEELAGNGLRGVGPWLDHAWTALAQGRADAIDRLLREVPLPDGAAGLTDLVGAAALGLRWRVHAPAERFLALGRAGVRVGGRQVPDRQTRAAVAALQVRLAAVSEPAEVAEALIDDIGTPATGVLRAMLARLSGADTDWEAEGSGLDTAAEAAARGRDGTGVEERISGARLAVEGLPSLDDVESDLDRLVEPAPELWWAVAERALREDDQDTARLAVDRAEAQALPGDSPLRAEILQIRAGLEADPAATLTEAGICWVDAGELERAGAAYTRALSVLGPDGPPQEIGELKMRRADCVITLAQDKVAAGVEQELRDSVGWLEQARTAFDGDLGPFDWCFVSEALARLHLARLMIADRTAQHWLALRASLRAVAYAFDDGDRWAHLAGTADVLEMNQVSLWASGVAEELGDNPEIRWSRLRVLSNTGAYQEVLDRLDDDGDVYTNSVRGFCLLRLGRAQEALEVYRGLTIEPGLTWAWWQYLMTALIAGDVPTARGIATDLSRDLAARPGERDVLFGGAMAKLVLGESDEVEAMFAGIAESAEGTDRDDALEVIGIARIVRGDTARGTADLTAAMTATRRAAAVIDWRSTTRPLILAVADLHGAPRPDFSEIEAFYAAVERDWPTDPLGDARARAESDDLPPDLRSETLALLAAVHGARAGAADLAALPESLAAEREQLQNWLHRPAPAEPASVEIEEPDEPAADPPIFLMLPTSWFEEHDDPVATHPLFRTALPEARAVASWTVPSATIRAEDELEPDGFRLEVHGDPVATGTIPTDVVFVPAAAAGLLPAPVARAAVPYQPEWLDLPLLCVPPAPAGDRHTLVDLLTFDRWALAARLVTADLCRRAVEGPQIP
jgi:tetratricopeptide (TPR) repeat protein